MVRNKAKTQTRKPEKALAQVPEFDFIKKELVNIAAIKKSFDKTQLEFVRKAVNKDLTDTELLIFLSFGGKLQLNPVLKELIAIVYHKNDPAKRVVSYIIPRDGKRIVAARTGGLESVTKEGIYVKEIEGEGSSRCEPWEGGVLWGATATVTRDGVDYEVTVPLEEYNTNENVWKKKPETMIKKVAESQALSAAYPELLSGVYDDAEYGSMPRNGYQNEIVVPNGDEPATPAQIEALGEQGKEVPEGLTKEGAVKLLTSKPKKAEKKGKNESTK